MNPQRLLHLHALLLRLGRILVESDFHNLLLFDFKFPHSP